MCASHHAHLIGICGTGMGSLAGLFHAAGYRVTGSDQQSYPPMSTMLAALGIPIHTGFSAAHLSPRPDVVIVGNVCTAQNPEARAAIDGGMPYFSLPGAVAHFFCADRQPLIIAGTHGKTTSASLAAWLLEAAGAQPSFLIGGIPQNFGSSYRLAGAPFVIEGDEYDSAFFDKAAKILRYPVAAAMLGPIEFDHADIYADLAAVIATFRAFVERIPSDGILAACVDSPHVRSLLPAAPCRVITYGTQATAAPQVTATQVQEGTTGIHFTLQLPQRAPQPGWRLPFTGQHNLQNALGVIALLSARGVDLERLRAGLPQFQGARRRQEVRGVVRDITVIDDFAHHPTAIRETLRGLQQRYPRQRLLVAYEPRSNTSGRQLFFDAYLEAFAGAALVLLAPVHKQDRIPRAEQLDRPALAQTLSARGTPSQAIDTTEGMVTTLCHHAVAGDVIVIMSNGDFDHLHEKVLQRLHHGPTAAP